MPTIINGRGRVGVRTSVGPGGGGGGYGTLTTSWIAATGETDTTILGALNTLESDLTSYGILSKMKALYPFVGGNATKHKYNFMNAQDTDAAFRLVFSGGWTHSSTGALPNGTNGYADTKLIPSSIQTENSNGLGMYITEETTNSNAIQIGSYLDGFNSSALAITSTLIGGRLNGAVLQSNISGGAGSFDFHRTSGTVSTIYKNGSQVITGFSGYYLPPYSIYLGVLNTLNTPYGASYSNSEFRLSYMSDGLDSTEVSNMRTAVQAFQTTLGRQV
jgi:hypothetical protein